jgi:acyl dehydratase
MDAFSLATAERHVGRELGVTGWMPVDQARIDEFARCTGDDQWIHVDAERAGRESPWGTTVAHGYLTLALLAPSAFEIYLRPAGISRAFNYGLEKARFLAPVKRGDRVRTRIALAGAAAKAAGTWLLTTDNTVEIEGRDKPALVARTLLLVEP